MADWRGNGLPWRVGSRDAGEQFDRDQKIAELRKLFPEAYVDEPYGKQ